MEKYCDTNLNHYIKIKLTEEGRIIYKKYYNSHNCEAPKLDIDDEGYVRFQIHDFMHIFGERLFMGATLPCETNCKIQVKDEWHYVKDGDLPNTETKNYTYIRRRKRYERHFTDYRVIKCYVLCINENGKITAEIGYFDCNKKCFLDKAEGKIYAWKEIVPPQIKEE